MTTLEELYMAIQPILPNAVLSEDFSGEITISTGLELDEYDKLVEVEQ